MGVPLSTMSAPSIQRPFLPALTSIRFFAALWVALFHMTAMKAFDFSNPALQHLASIGYSGVSFFFVLSGFILVYTYSGRSTSHRAFWQARFARVYPALAFALLLTAPGFFYCVVQMRARNPHLFVPEWAWSAAHLSLAIPLNITLLESWIPQAALGWNMPNWSLSVEAFFYLLFPFLLLPMTRLSRRWLLAVLPLGCLFALACTLLYTRLQPEGAITPKTLGPWINTLKYHPLMRLPEFLMGMAAGLLFLRKAVPRRWAAPLVLAGLAVTAAVAWRSASIPYLVIHTALLAPAFTLLIYGVALRPTGVGLLEHRWMEALGEASYPFYLLHSLILGSFFLDWKTGVRKHQTLLGFCTWLLLAILIAVAVDRCIERPLRRLLRPSRKAVTAVAVPVPST